MRLPIVYSFELSEEDKRATTNVQNGLVFFFLFSFIQRGQTVKN